MVLVLVTFPLWRGSEPSLLVPMVSALGSLPSWMHWIALLLILVACVAIVATAESRHAWLWWIVAVGFCVSFVLNQHRLQPWAYQSAIYAVVFATMDRETARRWLIPLAASVYLYSGLGKLDYQFAHTVGQNFLAAVELPGIGNLADRFEHNVLAVIALLLPLSEALIAIGLLFRRTRRIAGFCVMLLHFSLVIMLGPWNLDHSAGVLFWNVLLIIQAWFLFLKPLAKPRESSPPPSHADVPADAKSIGKRFAQAIVILAILMPVTERWGYWDHWTSWALYSPHSSRAEVQIHRSAMDQLPASMHPFLVDDDSDGWHRLQMNLWSLDRLNVPVYPQARFQLAVASRIAHLYDLSDSVRVIVKGVADRRSGAREERRSLGRNEIDGALQHFWITQ
ncbi:hypothetical protein Rcae01_02558 [Novipirellula caenicola]|uniref:Vitamin K-dependent gamma-carboxylase n=2 Tax=Novipirellula caenicola TaxID=1536901 RepID=A0ABP9VPJ5_9BACT